MRDNVENKYCIDGKEKDKVVYIVLEDDETKVFVKGMYYRVCRYIEKENVIYLSNEDVQKHRREHESFLKKLKDNMFSLRVKGLLGTILHIDGDREYMENCMSLYKEMGIHAYGIYIEEKDMPKKVGAIVKKLLPDVIVITGHDYYNKEGLTDLANYKNTKNFMEACLECRRNKVDSIIVAGACQSNSEALLISGANFASSPKRINIHTYDPAIIAVKAVSTSSERYIDKSSLGRKIENFNDAYMGIETKGKMKILI